MVNNMNVSSIFYNFYNQIFNYFLQQLQRYCLFSYPVGQAQPLFHFRCKSTAFIRLLLVNNYHFFKLAAKVLLFFSSRCLIIGTNFHARIVLFIPLLFFLPLFYVHCPAYYSVISPVASCVVARERVVGLCCLSCCQLVPDSLSPAFLGNISKSFDS